METTQQREVERPADLSAIVRKGIYKTGNPGFVSRLLLPIQLRVTYLLLRWRVNSRQVTIIWLCVFLIAFALYAGGTPLLFLLASVAIYFAIMLDGCDGEIGRYDGQFMTPEENLATFANGIYLDKAAHGIVSALWGVAIAGGLYQLTHDPAVWIAGLAIVVFHSFVRSGTLAEKFIIERFRGDVQQLVEERQLEIAKYITPRTPSAVIRIADTVELWLRNGKRFNLLFTAAAIADCGCLYGSIGSPKASYWLLLAVGIVSPLLVIHMMVKKAGQGVLMTAICKDFQQKADEACKSERNIA